MKRAAADSVEGFSQARGPRPYPQFADDLAPGGSMSRMTSLMEEAAGARLG